MRGPVHAHDHALRFMLSAANNPMFFFKRKGEPSESQSDGVQKRKHKRILYSYPVEMIIGEKRTQRSARTLSAGGLYIAAPFELPLETLIHLENWHGKPLPIHRSLWECCIQPEWARHGNQVRPHQSRRPKEDSSHYRQELVTGSLAVAAELRAGNQTESSVIPANAGILTVFAANISCLQNQAGFRLALRLAGMTMEADCRLRVSFLGSTRRVPP